MKKSQLITILIILAVLILAYFLIFNKNTNTDAETAKCIGENSVLYTQLGCYACGIQEEMFGDNYGYLNVVDCFYEREKCSDITGTPTWKINRENYRGVQSIERLKEVTGC